jgi:quinol monooxygenase YgiN
MLTMTVIAQVKPEKQQEFRHAINSLYSNAEEEEKGLKKSTLYQEVDDPRGFRLVTEWETQKDLEGYLGAENFRVLLGALEILCATSEIRYSHLAEKGGGVRESKP